jgi:hypothetical protein
VTVVRCWNAMRRVSIAARNIARPGARPRSNNKRKDNVLFSGLLNPNPLDLWLDAMRHYRVPVAGIYSLPLLSAGW